MSGSVLMLDCEQPENGVEDLARRLDTGRHLTLIPLYELDRQDLACFRAIILPMHCDQLYLARLRERLSAYVRAGGIAMIGGHVREPYLEGLARFHPIPDYRVEDLVVHSVAAHPVWHGVEMKDLTWRRGVAGFYGRGWHPPPAGAQIINVLGAAAHPIDFEYRLGQGKVLVHGGNDLWTYQGTGSTAERLAPQLIAWLAGEVL